MFAVPRTLITVICLLLIFLACSEKSRAEKERDINEELRSYLMDWIGTPYQLGGSTKEGIDCSALTQNIYKEIMQLEIPRRVTQQRTEGLRIQRDSLLAGDLVVFLRLPYSADHILEYISLMMNLCMHRVVKV